MRVYEPGQKNHIYKASRPAMNVWNFDARQCTWALPKKGMEVQFWWINPKVLGDDSKIGTIQVRADAPSGVISQSLTSGNFEAILKYRIDN